jgi:hypothetical protein
MSELSNLSYRRTWWSVAALMSCLGVLGGWLGRDWVLYRQGLDALDFKGQARVAPAIQLDQRPHFAFTKTRAELFNRASNFGHRFESPGSPSAKVGDFGGQGRQDGDRARSEIETFGGSSGQGEQALAALGARLDARFQNEPRDSGWSSSTVAELRAVLLAEAPKSRLLEVSCHSTLCRVVMECSNSADRFELARSIAAKSPFNHGVVYVHGTPNNSLITTLYVVREGHTFDE